MKKFVSIILVLSMAVSLAGVNVSAIAPSTLSDECMPLNKMLEEGYWVNGDKEKICGCKTCRVLITDYNNIPEALDKMGFYKLAQTNIKKEYRSEIGKDISKAVGETALSIALLNADFLKLKGFENIASTIDHKIGSKFFYVRLGAGVISFLSAGAWYVCKISADEASEIIEMTESMLDRLATYSENDSWKKGNYLLMSYDKKDGTNAIKFGNHKSITYSKKESSIHEKYFKQLGQNASTLSGKIKSLHEDYKKQLEMKRNNKWYKTFVTVGPNVLLGSVFTTSCIGKLLKMFENGHIPTSEEFDNIISETGFEGEISEKQKIETMRAYSKAYKALSKEGKKNPDEFIQMSKKSLDQIRNYNKSAITA